MRNELKLSLILAAAAALLSANAFATYIVALKNGTTYKAKAKWTLKGGKAYVSLENGELLALDPSLIDEPKSEQMTKSGLGDANVLAVGSTDTAPAAKQQPSLGASIKLRKLAPSQSTAPAPGPSTTAPATAPPALPVSGGNLLSQEVVEKFARAYENVGLFEQKLTATGPRSLRADLTADSEDKVFNAISATSFLMVRNAGVPGAEIDVVELFMKTTNGGSSGRFQMTRDEAQALDAKKISQQEYFVRRVIY
jgi:hypothetical protein